MGRWAREEEGEVKVAQEEKWSEFQRDVSWLVPEGGGQARSV